MLNPILFITNIISEFCYEDPEIGSCRNASNMWFFNRNHSRCDVFTWSCGDHGNRFATNDQCSETCTGITSDFRTRVVNNRFNSNRRRNNGDGDRSDRGRRDAFKAHLNR